MAYFFSRSHLQDGWPYAANGIKRIHTRHSGWLPENFIRPGDFIRAVKHFRFHSGKVLDCTLSEGALAHCLGKRPAILKSCKQLVCLLPCML